MVIDTNVLSCKANTVIILLILEYNVVVDEH